jgi:hypothetical protein
VPRYARHSLESAAIAGTAQESLADANLENLTRDLNIWIVKHYYQPKTLLEVKQLKSGLHQGGLECLLRYILQQEDDRLRDPEYKLLASSIEHWIQFVWESEDTELMQTLEKNNVVTTGQLIGWLDENCYAADSLLDAVIEKLKQRAP